MAYVLLVVKDTQEHKSIREIPITLAKHVTHLPPRKSSKHEIPIILSKHVSNLQLNKSSKYAILVYTVKTCLVLILK